MAMRTLLQRSMTVGFACSENAGAFAGPNVRSRLRIVPCGIDLEAFRRPRPDRARLRGALGLPEDVPILGHVGRLAPEKNHAFLLRVAARLIRDVPRLRLVIAGGGERTALEGLGRRLGLRQRVVFTGPRDDVPDLLGGVFDALALPSLREGLPGVVLEAQAAGLACVVSEHTPAEAVVAPELVETVWLNQGAGPWAAALGRALGKPRADREDACSRLRERGFDAATSFRVLTETYEEGLAAAPAGSGLGRAYGARALGRGSS
jgi:glycosyltransferase EpsF